MHVQIFAPWPVQSAPVAATPFVSGFAPDADDSSGQAGQSTVLEEEIDEDAVMPEVIVFTDTESTTASSMSPSRRMVDDSP